MDSFWTTYSDYIIGIPTAILAILAIWISLRQWKKKRLEYKIVANESLLSYHKDIKQDLVINYKGKEVVNLTLFNIEFINTGNKEILKTDFESSLFINMGEINEILSIEIQHLDNIDVKTDINKHIIEILPLLINPKVSFSLKILIDKKESNFRPQIKTIIAGIKEVEEFKESIIFKNSLILLLTFSVLALSMVFTYFEKSLPVQIILGIFMIMPIYIFLMFVGTLLRDILKEIYRKIVS